MVGTRLFNFLNCALLSQMSVRASSTSSAMLKDYADFAMGHSAIGAQKTFLLWVPDDGCLNQNM